MDEVRPEAEEFTGRMFGGFARRDRRVKGDLNPDAMVIDGTGFPTVHGIDGLRVIGASVMPVVLSATRTHRRSWWRERQPI